MIIDSVCGGLRLRPRAGGGERERDALRPRRGGERDAM
jgi:hypothetical protein